MKISFIVLMAALALCARAQDGKIKFVDDDEPAAPNAPNPVGVRNGPDSITVEAAGAPLASPTAAENDPRFFGGPIGGALIGGALGAVAGGVIGGVAQNGYGGGYGGYPGQYGYPGFGVKAGRCLLGSPIYPGGYGAGYPGGYPVSGAYPVGGGYPAVGGVYPGAGGVYPGAGGVYPGAGGVYPAAGGVYPAAGGVYPATGYGVQNGYRPGYNGYGGYNNYGGYKQQQGIFGGFRTGENSAEDTNEARNNERRKREENGENPAEGAEATDGVDGRAAPGDVDSRFFGLKHCASDFDCPGLEKCCRTLLGKSKCQLPSLI